MPNTGDNVFLNTITASNTLKKYGSGVKRLQYNEKEPLPLKKNFTIGCDPEGFIFEKKRDKPVPASLFIPGTKWEPHKVDKGAVQVDGLAAEFNTDPANTIEEWEDNISSVIKQLRKFIPKTHELRFVPSVTFEPEDFDPAPDECKELGCSPDIDAWTDIVNNPPHSENPYIRVAGGHVHIGWTKDEALDDPQHILNCRDLIRQCDFFLGSWGSIMDTDTIRPQLYGKMGACRYKPYGAEYRVLSNFWVDSEDFRRDVWNRACKAIDCMAETYLPDRIPTNLIKQLRSSIQTHAPSPDLMNAIQFPMVTLNPYRNRW